MPMIKQAWGNTWAFLFAHALYYVKEMQWKSASISLVYLVSHELHAITTFSISGSVRSMETEKIQKGIVSLHFIKLDVLYPKSSRSSKKCLEIKGFPSFAWSVCQVLGGLSSTVGQILACWFPGSCTAETEYPTDHQVCRSPYDLYRYPSGW